MQRLHQRIKDLEKDKARLRAELDRKDYATDILNGVGDHTEMEIYDALKVSLAYMNVTSSRHALLVLNEF